MMSSRVTVDTGRFCRDLGTSPAVFVPIKPSIYPEHKHGIVTT